MRIALAQYALDIDMEANLIKALAMMEEAGRRSADLVLFPELCLSHFFPQYAGRDATQFGLPIDHAYVAQFRESSQRLRLSSSPNVYLHEAGRYFDASFMINSSGEVLGTSKMVHIAQVPCFYEQDYYTPSDTGFRVFDLPFGKVGIVVCFDRHFPESIRTCVLRGASLILIPTANTLDEPGDLFDCELRAAALQNGVYIAMCNRVGAEGAITFSGESVVVDPEGNIVVKGNNSENLIVADLDLPQTVVARTKRPYLSLRRPNMYEL